MNMTLKTILMTGLLSASVLSATAHAGIQEQIKSKVDAIKTDTGTLKTRTSNLIDKANEQTQRLEEVASTANAVIAETDIIKNSLQQVDGVFDTVRVMKDRFTELQFDPAELIQNDQLQNAIAKFKEKKAAAEERLNDPDLETFRHDFLNMLGKVNSMLRDEEAETEVLPLQSLVEMAPAPVIGVLKFAVGPVFPKLHHAVNSLYANTEEMRALGLWGYDMYQQSQCAQSQIEHNQKLELLYKSSQELIDVIRDLKIMELKIEVQEWDLGVHGYTGTKVTTGDDAKQQVQSLIIKFKARQDEFDLKREKLNAKNINCS